MVRYGYGSLLSRQDKDMTAYIQLLLFPCREWTGTRNKQGYGYDGKWNRRVHRLEWIKQVGPIPTGMLVMHLCDNPPCHEITHLRLGISRDNTADMLVKGRWAGGSPSLPGELSPRSSLTNAQVAEIRRRHIKGVNPSKRGNTVALAAEFGVARHVIERIANGQTYPGVNPGS